MSAPSTDAPLGGGCLCGSVRYELTEPFSAAGYCHCSRCQRRSGTAASANGIVARSGLSLISGEELLRSYTPEGGKPKVFCSHCGSALFAGDPLSDEQVGVRLGTLDGDPGIRPGYHQHLSSAAVWEPIPDDGLPRFDGARTA